MAPKLAALATDPNDMLVSRSQSSNKGPSSFNREALLREREEARRKAAARRAAGGDTEKNQMSNLNKRATPAQTVATLFAATHGFLTNVPLHQVVMFESRLWGSLATLPAPAEFQNERRPIRSLLDVLLEAPAPEIHTEVTAETLTADHLAGALVDNPVWMAVHAVVHGLAESYAGK